MKRSRSSETGGAWSGRVTGSSFCSCSHVRRTSAATACGVSASGRSNTSSGCCSWPLPAFFIRGFTHLKNNLFRNPILDSSLATPR